MDQLFFEIPLTDREADLFAVDRFDTEESRRKGPFDEDDLLCEGLPFYARTTPALVHWQKGWSLILPRQSRCPNLLDSGQCRVYQDRPEVCRRPQIFPYMVERLEDNPERQPVYRIRQSLLAITDCPYVSILRDEIAEYAAASELQLVFNRNKA